MKISFSSQCDYILFPTHVFYREQGFRSVSEAVGADHRAADRSTHKLSPLKEIANTDAAPVAATTSY